MNTTMEYKGFKAEVREAQRLTGDHIHELPPGSPLPVYHVDQFVNVPENWMKGPGVFVIPVRPDKGLWFDWRGNSHMNTAIIPTVKGCNPITGLQTSGFHMERYENKCPKHNCDFMAERFCPECNYKWPSHNYVSVPNILWWDGFRAEDGTVRQFFFTEDMMRDVATHLIGKENTVPAFGFAFYTPKKRREKPRSITRGINTGGGIISPPHGSLIGDFGFDELKTSYVVCNDSETNTGSVNVYNCSSSESLMVDKPLSSSKYLSSVGNVGLGTPNPDKLVKPLSMGDPLGSKRKSRSFSESALRKKSAEVSIGAGAKIRQELSPDPYLLDSWKDTPDAAMTIYFVFQEKLEELKAGGMRDLSGSKEGMLENIPVG